MGGARRLLERREFLAVLGVEEPHDRFPAPRQESAPVGRPGEGVARLVPRMSLPGDDRFERRGVPDRDAAVVARDRETRVVTAKREGIGRGGLGGGEPSVELRPGVEAPERPIAGGRDDERPVGRKRDVEHVVVVATEGRAQTPIGGIPEAYRPVVGRGGEGRSIGGANDAGDVVGVTAQCEREFAGRRVPDPCGLVLRRPGDEAAVGRPRQPVDGVVEAFVRHRALRHFAPLDLPHEDAEVPRPRGDLLAVGREADPDERLATALERADDRAVARVPEAHRPDDGVRRALVGTRRDQRPVRAERRAPDRKAVAFEVDQDLPGRGVQELDRAVERRGDETLARGIEVQIGDRFPVSVEGGEDRVARRRTQLDAAVGEPAREFRAVRGHREDDRPGLLQPDRRERLVEFGVVDPPLEAAKFGWRRVEPFAGDRGLVEPQRRFGGRHLRPVELVAEGLHFVARRLAQEEKERVQGEGHGIRPSPGASF